MMRLVYICEKCDCPIYPYVGCRCTKPNFEKMVEIKIDGDEE